MSETESFDLLNDFSTENNNIGSPSLLSSILPDSNNINLCNRLEVNIGDAAENNFENIVENNNFMENTATAKENVGNPAMEKQVAVEKNAVFENVAVVKNAVFENVAVEKNAVVENVAMENPISAMENPNPVVENPNPVVENPNPVVETPNPVVENPITAAENPIAHITTIIRKRKPNFASGSSISTALLPAKRTRRSAAIAAMNAMGKQNELIVELKLSPRITVKEEKDKDEDFKVSEKVSKKEAKQEREGNHDGPKEKSKFNSFPLDEDKNSNYNLKCKNSMVNEKDSLKDLSPKQPAAKIIPLQLLDDDDDDGFFSHNRAFPRKSVPLLMNDSSPINIHKSEKLKRIINDSEIDSDSDDATRDHYKKNANVNSNLSAKKAKSKDVILLLSSQSSSSSYSSDEDGVICLDTPSSSEAAAPGSASSSRANRKRDGSRKEAKVKDKEHSDEKEWPVEKKDSVSEDVKNIRALRKSNSILLAQLKAPVVSDSLEKPGRKVTAQTSSDPFLKNLMASINRSKAKFGISGASCKSDISTVAKVSSKQSRLKFVSCNNVNCSQGFPKPTILEKEHCINDPFEGIFSECSSKLGLVGVTRLEFHYKRLKLYASSTPEIVGMTVGGEETIIVHRPNCPDAVMRKAGKSLDLIKDYVREKKESELLAKELETEDQESLNNEPLEMNGANVAEDHSQNSNSSKENQGSSSDEIRIKIITNSYGTVKLSIKSEILISDLKKILLSRVVPELSGKPWNTVNLYSYANLNITFDGEKMLNGSSMESYGVEDEDQLECNL